MERETIAYGLMLLMALALAAYVGWKVYHSRERSYRRKQSRQGRNRKAAQDPV